MTLFTAAENRYVRKALRSILADHGEKVFLKPKQLRKCAEEALSKDTDTPYLRLIGLACDHNVYAMLLDTAVADMNERVKKAAAFFVERTFLKEPEAQCAVEWVADAIRDPKGFSEVEGSLGLTYIRDEKDANKAYVSGIGTCTDTDIVIPLQNEYGQEVIGLKSSAFSSSSIVSIEMHENIKEIPSHAFFSCGELKCVRIPNTVTVIGESAFSFCSTLKEIHLPESVTEIRRRGFMYCGALETVTLSEGLKTIGESAFEACSSLTNIRIPNSVKTIEVKAFENCNQLSLVTMNKRFYQLKPHLAFQKTRGVSTTVRFTNRINEAVDIKRPRFLVFLLAWIAAMGGLCTAGELFDVPRMENLGYLILYAIVSLVLLLVYSFVDFSVFMLFLSPATVVVGYILNDDIPMVAWCLLWISLVGFMAYLINTNERVDKAYSLLFFAPMLLLIAAPFAIVGTILMVIAAILLCWLCFSIDMKKAGVAIVISHLIAILSLWVDWFIF